MSMQDEMKKYFEVEGRGVVATMTEDYDTGKRKVTVATGADGTCSDRFHTFDELYEFRMLYNAAFFNEIAKRPEFNVHKSEKHADGELCFGGGWFIVMATLPTGQISNHYEMKDWNLFKCESREVAEAWDGHTSKDVVERMYGHLFSAQYPYPQDPEASTE